MPEPDIDSDAALALRALQKFDQIAKVDKHSPVISRPLFLEALDALGRNLGLECTGVKELHHTRRAPKVPLVGYDHSGGTCPIHEWLVEGDYIDIEREEDA